MIRTLYEGVYALEAPKYLKRILRVRGGVNRFGEANYRVVRTEARKRLSFGIWREFSQGTSLRDRNANSRAWRTFVGYKPVPMYPGEHGWVLERWVKPEFYGSAMQWELPMSMGGTLRWFPELNRSHAAFGGFPERGDYEGTCYIFRTSKADALSMVDDQMKPISAEEAEEIYGELSESLIVAAIGRLEETRAGMPKSPEARAQMLISQEQSREEKADEDRSSRDQDILDDVGGMAARTPGGWAEIHKLAESIGIRNHLGG